MHRPDTPPASQLEAKRPRDPPSPSPKPSKICKSGEESARAEGEEEEQVEAEDRCRSQAPGSMSQNPRIQRYLVAVEYIGTRFSGSQQQPNCRTVVGVLEDAFRKFIGQPVSIFCSSRTDAGVHALSNVCHVDVERISKRKPGEVLPPHDPGVVRRAVNHFLQANSPIRTLDELHVCEVFPFLCFPSTKEREQMHAYQDSLLSPPSQSAIATDAVMRKFKMESQQEFGQRKRHHCYVITARARSFLYHQVRLLVGVLKAVGTGDLTVSDVERILNAKTVTAVPPMAPAYGLYLGNVKYDLP